MGMDPQIAEWQVDEINRLLWSRIVSANTASKIIDMLRQEPDPQSFDPREQFKHHVRDYPQPRKAVDFPDIP